MHTDQRIELARTYHRQGHNCAQSVAMAFADITHCDPSLLRDATVGLGGGLGGTRHTCGALTGAAVVAGLVMADAPKAEVYKLVANVVEHFRQSNSSTECATLKEQGKKPCQALIDDAVRLLSEQLQCD